MTPSAQATSIRHGVTVDAPIERAFAVFTEDFGRFKPREHNMLASTSPRPSSSPAPADASTTVASTAASANGRACWPTSRPTEW